MNKNTVKAFIVAIAMVCTSNLNSFANNTNDETPASVKTKISQVNKTLSFNVWVENTGKKVMVVVLDADKNEIYREYVGSKSEKFAKTFDFSNLSDGKYTLEVVSSNVNVIDSKTFEIRTNQIVNRDIIVAIR
ncbi:MAG: hypothetical protein H7339_01785 [Arcicella sp.]|nr:hypothetical protein [Arcicella sp.]